MLPYFLKSKKNTESIDPKVSTTINSRPMILSTCVKLMSETDLRPPAFTHSACDAFTKSKEIIQKFKQTGDSRYIYKNELDKDCFQHDMAYGDFKDLKKRTAADKFLRDKAFNIAKNPKYDEYQRVLASMVNKFFDKKTKDSGITLANKSAIKSISHNEQLAEQLHKLIIRKFSKKESIFSIQRQYLGCRFSRYAIKK